MFLIFTKIQICNSHTNCYLCAVMKKVFLKYVAAFLTVWYCMSIIGFDVHSCTTTGNTFVNSVLTGLTCEDIHPEHDCAGHDSCCGSHKSHSCSCCHSHEVPASENYDKDSSCCTDSIEVLDCEGVTYSNNEVIDLISACPSAHFTTVDYDSLLLAEAQYILFGPKSGHIQDSDVQSVLNIWRI